MNRVIFFCLIAGLAMTGCAGSKPKAPHANKRGFVASSDTVWLSEMLAQRLVISSEVSWSRFQTGRGFSDEEKESGEASAFVEQCVRLGLPARESREFFEAQQAASAEQESQLFLTWSKNPNPEKGPARNLENVLIPQLETVNAQLVSVFVRLQGFPRGKALRQFLLERLEVRGLNRRVSEIAVKPFGPSRKKPEPTEEISDQPLQSTLVPRVSM